MKGEDRPIQLLICDDHPLIRDALALVLGPDATIEMAAAPVADPHAAIEACAQLQPDVVLMDVEFNASLDGIEATRRIKEVSHATKIVIMTGNEDERLLLSAVEAGATGFLRKTSAVQDVVETVKAAARDEVLIDPRTLARLMTEVAREREMNRQALLLIGELTEREREILGLLAKGFRTEDIASKLYISPRTAQNHIQSILKKLRVRSKLEAVMFAARVGAVSTASAS